MIIRVTATESVLQDETAESVTKHLIDTYQHLAPKGIVTKRELTYNSSRYRSKMFAEACQTLNMKFIFAQPYTPPTNGKAERFIQTLLCKWSCAGTYTSSDQRNGNYILFDIFFQKNYFAPFIHRT